MIKIYTTPTCSFCTKAKDLLNDTGLDYEELDARLPENKAELVRLTGKLMVPVTVIGDKVISGFDNLEKWDKNPNE